MINCIKRKLMIGLTDEEKAEIYNKKGKYEKAVELNPNNPLYYYNLVKSTFSKELCISLMEVYKVKYCASMLEKALSLNPDKNLESKIKNLLAVFYFRLAKYGSVKYAKLSLEYSKKTKHIENHWWIKMDLKTAFRRISDEKFKEIFGDDIRKPREIVTYGRTVNRKKYGGAVDCPMYSHNISLERCRKCSNYFGEDDEYVKCHYFSYKGTIII
jgi:tetratricopeptide (TPR) repeat protein